ncbi:hypothetical protein [Streptosporangium roseum]|uniref:hypothetical protein n=1 Tax=Streptosporangium roseum TaxID=2001 RepID=UPI003320A54E
MTKHNVNITTGHHERPRVEVDGTDISSGLRGVNIEIGLDGIPRIEAEIAVSVIDVMRLASPNAEVVLSLPPGAHEALVALGWTPPNVASAHLGYAVIETDHEGNNPSFCVHGPDPVDTVYEDAEANRASNEKSHGARSRFVVCKLVPVPLRDLESEVRP